MSPPEAIAEAVPEVAAVPSTDAAEKREKRRLVERWGEDLLEPGWVALPAIILEKQAALSLDALDLNIIMHLARRWFDADQPPSPGKQGIADAINCDPRTVQRRIAALERRGLIARKYRRSKGKGTKGSQTNEYDLSGLLVAAKPYAKEWRELRARHAQEQAARAVRKRPKVAPAKVEP